MSLAVAGAAWAVSGDLVRAVAVLVVATPCPLILAAPVSIVSGLSCAARRGVVVKGGAALERLGGGEVLLFDKTGTITVGHPTLSEVVTAGTMRADEILRLAASLDQVSPHVLAAAVVRAARARGDPVDAADRGRGGPGLRSPGEGRRSPGGGRQGQLGLGRPRRRAWVRSLRRRAELDGLLTVFVQVDGVPVGALLLEDPIRGDAARTIRQLRRDGIRRIVMVTGDREDTAQAVGAVIGVDDVLAERTPAEKVDAVSVERRWGPTDHGGRRDQRRARARARRRRRRDRRPRIDGVVGGGRRRADCRPARSARRGDSDRSTVAAHRVRECRRGHRAVVRRNVRRRARLPSAGRGRGTAGADRCRRHPQCTPRPA